MICLSQNNFVSAREINIETIIKYKIYKSLNVRTQITLDNVWRESRNLFYVAYNSFSTLDCY